MKYLLASFCNIPYATTSPLALISLPLNKKSRVIPISLEDMIGTATGLARGEGKIFVAYMSESKFKLSVLDEKTLFVLYNFDFPSSQDVHSMLYDKGYLYTVSTGTDELIRYKVGTSELKSPEIIWRASDDKKENHHINSICKFKGDILLSGFGKGKMDNVWRTAYDGIIFNVTKGIILRDKIYQPHSVSSNGDEIFYCESGYGKFSSLSKNLKTLDGYTRGVQFESKESVFVATSIGRSKNKSNIIYNPADYGKKKGKCGIYNLDSKGRITSYLDFGWFANEIYDLLILDTKADIDALALRSFLNERKKFSEAVSEHNKFWQYIKRKTK